jgi:hypothetical protein
MKYTLPFFMASNVTVLAPVQRLYLPPSFIVEQLVAKRAMMIIYLIIIVLSLKKGAECIAIYRLPTLKHILFARRYYSFGFKTGLLRTVAGTPFTLAAIETTLAGEDSDTGGYPFFFPLLHLSECLADLRRPAKITLPLAPAVGPIGTYAHGGVEILTGILIHGVYLAVIA